MAENGKAKPKMQLIIEHFDRAYQHLNAAAQMASSMSLEITDAASSVCHYRDELVKIMEASGGDTSFALETEIGKFIPAKYRTPEPDSAQS